MRYEKWIENVTPDDMPNDDLKYVAYNAGLKQALILIFLLPGLSLYIPKLGLKRLKENYIIKNYDGRRTTINRLAIECNLSQRHIYKIINKHLSKNKTLPPTS